MRQSLLTFAAAFGLAAAQSTNPNDPCAPQAIGYAPPTPGSASNFLGNPIYQAISQFAVTPSGYNRAFASLDAASSAANYMGFQYLLTYNTTGCAAVCNQMNGCVAFNIYIERDPTLNPAAACPNPPSEANYKCSFWGSDLSPATATNTGQYRNQFEVVIAGSNGYNQS